MKKLMKSQETLTVQAGTNGSCYCTYPCGTQTGKTRDEYHAIQRDSASTGNAAFSVSENE